MNVVLQAASMVIPTVNLLNLHSCVVGIFHPSIVVFTTLTVLHFVYFAYILLLWAQLLESPLTLLIWDEILSRIYVCK